MNTDFEIRTFQGGRFIGNSLMNSFENNRSYELWSGFMPRKNEILQPKSRELFAVQRYPSDFFKGPFQPKKEFEILALCPVEDSCEIPNGMMELYIPESKFAVFNYKGTSANFTNMAQYIYGQWLPISEFEADQRPHFQIMGEKYLGPENPNSEEEVWVPLV